jgi:threonine aldolase
MGDLSIQALSGSGPRNPAEFMRQIADWCEQNNVQFDNYGTGALIEDFEAKIAALLGFPAARFMPSGTLAQMTALKVWCDEADCQHFGMHPTSHLEVHEEHSYSNLYKLRGTLVGPKYSPLLAEHIEALDEEMAALLMELPIREAGGQLPSWDQLNQAVEAAKSRGLRLHLDGARLWEAQCFYQRDFSEICAGFDSVYVSFYKGIGALSGAMLLGSEEFIAQTKLWQRRAGGTIYTLAPQVASAAMLFDDSLSRLPAYCARAKQVVFALADIPALRFMPEVPQINMVHVYLPFSVEAANRARDQVEAEYSIQIFKGAAVADDPEQSYFELSVGENLLHLSDERIQAIFSKLISVGIQQQEAIG